MRLCVGVMRMDKQETMREPIERKDQFCKCVCGCTVIRVGRLMNPICPQCWIFHNLGRGKKWWEFWK